MITGPVEYHIDEVTKEIVAILGSTKDIRNVFVTGDTITFKKVGDDSIYRIIKNSPSQFVLIKDDSTVVSAFDIKNHPDFRRAAREGDWGLLAAYIIDGLNLG